MFCGVDNVNIVSYESNVCRCTTKCATLVLLILCVPLCSPRTHRFSAEWNVANRGHWFKNNVKFHFLNWLSVYQWELVQYFISSFCSKFCLNVTEHCNLILVSAVCLFNKNNKVNIWIHISFCAKVLYSKLQVWCELKYFCSIKIFPKLASWRIQGIFV